MYINYYKNIFKPFPRNEYIPFYINDHHIGFVSKEVSHLLQSQFSKIIKLEKSNLYLKQENHTFNNISQTINEIIIYLVSHGVSSLRREYMLVTDLHSGGSVCKIDRGFTHIFAIYAEGIHINAYTIKNGKKYMWISKRGNTKVEPYKYDNLVAGACSYGYSITQTLLKEAEEEANVPQNLSTKAQLQNCLKYKIQLYNGIKNDCIYIYNLQLPLDFIPQANDKEVESFYLMTLEEVFSLIKGEGKFKYNSALVTGYFLYKHNIIKDIDFKNLIEPMIFTPHF